MQISTQQIRELREMYARDRLLSYAPDSVQARSETILSILDEVLEYREQENLDGLAEVLRLDEGPPIVEEIH
jgi:hypothetical protein